MTTVVMSPVGVGTQWLSAAGVVLSGGKINTYLAGTTTPVNTYTDITGTVLNANPIILDSTGRYAQEIWWVPGQLVKLVITDSANNVQFTLDNLSGLSDATYYGSASLIGYTPPGTGAVATTVAAKLQQQISVLDFGADPTGTNNSYTAITNAVAYCKNIGAALFFPPGNYQINTASGTINLTYVTLIGSGVTYDQSNPTPEGSLFSIVGTTNTPFTVGPGVTFQGLGFYYPAQVDSATPIVFPPTIQTSNLLVSGAVNFVFITNCTVFNAYRFFADNTLSLGHCFFENNTIYGILTCFELSYNPEVITFSGNEFTFGVFLPGTEVGIRSYTRANGACIKVNQTDGITFVGNVCFGYQYGIQAVPTTGSGNGGKFQLTNINGNYFDQCRYGINVSGNGNVTALMIVGNSFYAYNAATPATICNAINISTTGAVVPEYVTFSGNSFPLATGDAINISGTVNRQYTFNGNQFYAWANGSSSTVYGAINISDGSGAFNITGNTFFSATSTYGSGLILAVSTALIGSNLFGNCYQPVNSSSNLTVAVGNNSYGTGATTSNVYAFAGLANTMDTANKWDKPATNAGSIAIALNNGTVFTNQTSGAAAAVGTLNNAPVAGNPGFWLPVTINGTNYYIPAWT